MNKIDRFWYDGQYFDRYIDSIDYATYNITDRRTNLKRQNLMKLANKKVAKDILITINKENNSYYLEILDNQCNR